MSAKCAASAALRGAGEQSICAEPATSGRKVAVASVAIVRIMRLLRNKTPKWQRFPLLNFQQTIVLGQPLGPCDGTHFDLTGAGRDREVGEKRVLGFTGARRDHCSVSSRASAVDYGEGFGQRSDLIHFHQHRIRDTLADAS